MSIAPGGGDVGAGKGLHHGQVDPLRRLESFDDNEDDETKEEEAEDEEKEEEDNVGIVYRKQGVLVKDRRNARHAPCTPTSSPTKGENLRR